MLSQKVIRNVYRLVLDCEPVSYNILWSVASSKTKQQYMADITIDQLREAVAFLLETGLVYNSVSGTLCSEYMHRWTSEHQ